MSSPQRYSKGVTNVDSSKTMGQLIVPDPTSVQVFMEDFMKFVPGDWFITRTHAGSTAGAETIGDASGGVLAFYPANADDDNTFFQYKATANVTTASEIFTLESTKKLWFKARLKVSDTGDSEFFIGLQSADTTPLTAPVDAVWWKSDDGDDYLDFGMYAASVSTLSETAIATIVDDTYFTVGFYWDGVDTIQYFYNDVIQGSSTATYPTAAMTVSFGVQNGSAAARTMSVDYIAVIKEH